MPNKTYIIHVGALWARLTTLQYMQYYYTLLKIVFPINIELIQTVLQKVDFLATKCIVTNSVTFVFLKL